MFVYQRVSLLISDWNWLVVQRNMGFRWISVSCWMLLDVAGLKWACKKLLTLSGYLKFVALLQNYINPKNKSLGVFGGRRKRSSFGRSPGQSISTRQLWHPLPKLTKSWPNFLASSLILESSNRKDSAARNPQEAHWRVHQGLTSNMLKPANLRQVRCQL